MPRTKPFRIHSPQSIGTAIRHYRREAGLTQAQLADLAGIDRSSLTHLELGREGEQVRRILRILRQLGVTVTLEKTGE